MNKDQILSIIRLTLTSIGVSLVATDTIDEITYTNLSGAFITLVSGIWSIYDKSDASMANKVAAYQAKINELENNVKIN